MLVADVRGTVVRCNDAAGLLLPAAVPGALLADVAPAWLAAAHTTLSYDGPHAVVPHAVVPHAVVPDDAGPLRGDFDGRRFEAHPSVRGDGSVAWWLVDDTDHQLAREALHMEQERSAFLAKASSALLSSLNLERCMDVSAQ
ncbi:serine/threonine protein phosphatase, partial [Streptomyces violaceoruber]